MTAVIERTHIRRQYTRYDTGVIYGFIIDYKRMHDGNSPTIREIMTGCDVTSTSCVVDLLERLQADGWIHLRRSGLYRGIEVIGGKWTLEGVR